MSDFSYTPSPEHEAGMSDRLTGLSLVIVFTMPIFWVWLKTDKLWLWTLPIAIVIAILAMWSPKRLAPLNRIFHLVTGNVHEVFSSIALMIIFFALVTPMGIALRLIRRNPMPLRKDGSRSSYWINSETPKSWSDYFRDQF